MFMYEWVCAHMCGKFKEPFFWVECRDIRATTNIINIFQRGSFFLKYFVIKMLVRYRIRDIPYSSIRVCEMMDLDGCSTSKPFEFRIYVEYLFTLHSRMLLKIFIIWITITSVKCRKKKSINFSNTKKNILENEKSCFWSDNK